MVHNSTVQTLYHPGVGPIKQVRPAVTFSGSSNAIRSAPPRLGEHTDRVLKDVLALTEEELEKLRRDKVVA